MMNPSLNPIGGCGGKGCQYAPVYVAMHLG